MRNFGIRVSAIFVLLWYCLGIIGFNVHTCASTDSSYVVTLLGDLSCSSIHPADQCGTVKKCCCCCSHTSEASTYSDESIDASKCCTNDYQVLLAAADRVDENQRLNLTSCVSTASFLSSFDSNVIDSVRSVSYINGPPISSLRTRGLHLVCSVWRI